MSWPGERRWTRFFGKVDQPVTLFASGVAAQIGIGQLLDRRIEYGDVSMTDDIVFADGASGSPASSS